jgi:hypothetical protein
MNSPPKQNYQDEMEPSPESSNHIQATKEDLSEMKPMFNNSSVHSIRPKKGDHTPRSESDLKEPSQLNSSKLQIQNEKYKQYDLQQLSYDLVKEYSHLRIDNDEGFMKRMLFDIFKRQTKDERMEKLIERNKVKIDENDRIKTFNRLIEDANRRYLAHVNMESLKNKIEEHNLPLNTKNKISEEEWKHIYEERFVKYRNDLEKWREAMQEVKAKEEKEKEEKLMQEVKTKKAPKSEIKQSVKRMYDEAERRRLKNEERNTSSKIERDLTPTKFKTKKKVKYNFTVKNYLIR